MLWKITFKIGEDIVTVQEFHRSYALAIGNAKEEILKNNPHLKIEEIECIDCVSMPDKDNQAEQ
ncbi:hypothetical protein DM558_00490 [Entomomonas moraniae]|uniref:Uncharacterized protein n=1 Tax=Entomomonas moraniae TaxID=2213226 RepID=A0A3Q9JK57_9GAMM|nr:hypothetical protein [Entomomonas moraniae]AZS49346.1 hypothetical protein DM558_00490 [Entomomonas moraniae]